MDALEPIAPYRSGRQIDEVQYLAIVRIFADRTAPTPSPNDTAPGIFFEFRRRPLNLKIQSNNKRALSGNRKPRYGSAAAFFGS